jgi:hypothetical protein
LIKLRQPEFVSGVIGILWIVWITSQVNEKFRQDKCLIEFGGIEIPILGYLSERLSAGCRVAAVSCATEKIDGRRPLRR